MPIDQIEAQRGIYRVRGEIWLVGPRYILHDHLGSGSYGDVCVATDSHNGNRVALKRIRDVLSGPILAKRVLREVCILRRLSHPHIIQLTDVFLQPSHKKNGLDIYIATELAESGDLLKLRRELDERQVQRLVWQLLLAVRYLHSCNVWHRDIKSQNTLLTAELNVKICDFGLARSAYNANNTPVPDTFFDLGRGSGGANILAGGPHHHNGTSSPGSLSRQYTRAVVTPCYRAPEVVMSKGEYTSKIDMWAVGCIFGELLQRLPRKARSWLGTPLFSVRYQPGFSADDTNGVDERDQTPLQEQLEQILRVIGTPAWHDIDQVPSRRWRDFLKSIPGHPGCLVEKVGDVGPLALDLLQRMLAFDPKRRCSADEALAHDYFKGIQRPAQLTPAPLTPANHGVGFWEIRDPAAALAELEVELFQMSSAPDGGCERLKWLLQQEVRMERQRQQQRDQRNGALRVPMPPSFHSRPQTLDEAMAILQPLLPRHNQGPMPGAPSSGAMAGHELAKQSSMPRMGEVLVGGNEMGSRGGSVASGVGGVVTTGRAAAGGGGLDLNVAPKRKREEEEDAISGAGGKRPELLMDMNQPTGGEMSRESSCGSSLVPDLKDLIRRNVSLRESPYPLLQRSPSCQIRPFPAAPSATTLAVQAAAATVASMQREAREAGESNGMHPGVGHVPASAENKPVLPPIVSQQQPAKTPPVSLSKPSTPQISTPPTKTAAIEGLALSVAVLLGRVPSGGEDRPMRGDSGGSVASMPIPLAATRAESENKGHHSVGAVVNNNNGGSNQGATSSNLTANNPNASLSRPGSATSSQPASVNPLNPGASTSPPNNTLNNNKTPSRPGSATSLSR